jgi:hypothetical protein
MCLSLDSFQTLWNTETNTYAKIKYHKDYSIFGQKFIPIDNPTIKQKKSIRNT